MNKKWGFVRYFAIFCIGFLLGTGKVFAENNHEIVGPDMVSPGEQVSYVLTIHTEDTINGYSGTLTYETSVLEFVGIEHKESWKGNNSITANSPIELAFTRDNGLTGQTEVAVLKFKVKTDLTKTDSLITFEGRTTTEEGGEIHTLGKATKSLTVKSTDNTLKDLKLNGKTIVNFAPKTSSYSVQVPSETTVANIDAELNNSTASFVDKFGPRSMNLEYGENVMEIKVKSAAGEEMTYVITITRMDNRGTNNDLKQIIINAGKVKIPFDKDSLEYTIKTHKLTKLEVEATAYDSKATVKIETPEEVKVGDNVVKIIVTSEDGKEKTYKITIQNVDYDIDTSLKDIEIFGLDEDLHFNSKVLDYEVLYKSKYKDSLVIKPILNNTEEDVQIDEPLLEKTSKNIVAGSVVQIRVFSPDGTESMYTITFQKDNRINFFFLLGLVIFGILLIIFIRLLMNRKKEKEEEKTKEMEASKNVGITKSSLNEKESVNVKRSLAGKEEEIELEKTKKIEKINLDD